MPETTGWIPVSPENEARALENRRRQSVTEAGCSEATLDRCSAAERDAVLEEWWNSQLQEIGGGSPIRLLPVLVVAGGALLIYLRTK